MKKVKKIVIILVLLVFSNTLFAEDTTKDIATSLELDKYLSAFDEYIKNNDIEGINAKELYQELISGNGIKYENILDFLVNNIIVQTKDTLKSTISIFLIIIIMAIVSSIELDSESDVLKITKLVVFIAVSAILLSNYLEIVAMFKNIVQTLGYIMQIVSTFLLGILLATGKISSVGIIQPMLLFIANIIVSVIQYIIIPLFTISIAINIVSRISDNIRMDNISSMFRKSSLYIFSTIIGIFLFVLSMETTITKSMDGIYFKTAQDILSNTIPVVGGFLSDSLNTVLGATQLIGKVGGVISLVITVLIVSIPIIKLVVTIILYNILISLSEPINGDKGIQEFLNGFLGVYKDMLGILIGIMVLFVMSTGIIMGIIGVVNG